ncbi:NAD(P)-dependent oxidoreductase [Blastococcus sp. SYSU DS1021]
MTTSNPTAHGTQARPDDAAPRITTGPGTRAGGAPPEADPVTVVGLGSMGSALARALLTAGVTTTAWNRSPARARPLAEEGAATAGTLASAVSAGSLIIVCLRDHAAFQDAFADLDPDLLRGRTVVHLSSATPAQARASADWAARRGMTYLNGAIMAPTPLIGTPDALILYSGPEAVFEDVRARLAPLGTAEHLGEDPARASLFDVAMLEVWFAGMTSFLHAAAMTTAHRVPAGAFLPYALRVVAMLPDTLAGLAGDVDAGVFPGDEDQLAMEAAALDHIVAAAEDNGTDTGLAAVLRDLTHRAVAAGHGADGFSRLIDHLRTRG